MYPHDVRLLAAKKLREQGPTPASPGLDDGKPRLCLAGALAWSGVRLRFGKAAASDFAARAVTSREEIRLAYEALGWSRAECDERMKMNDACAPGTRREATVSMVESTPYPVDAEHEQ